MLHNKPPQNLFKQQSQFSLTAGSVFHHIYGLTIVVQLYIFFSFCLDNQAKAQKGKSRGFLRPTLKTDTLLLCLLAINQNKQSDQVQSQRMGKYIPPTLRDYGKGIVARRMDQGQSFSLPLSVTGWESWILPLFCFC